MTYIPVPQYSPIYGNNDGRVVNHRALNDEDVKHDLQTSPSAYSSDLAKTITKTYFSGNGTLQSVLGNVYQNIIPTLDDTRSRQLSSPNLPYDVRAIWDTASGIKYGLETWMGSPGNFFDPASRTFTDEGWNELVTYINSYGNAGVLRKDLTEFGMGDSYINIRIVRENVIFDIKFDMRFHRNTKNKLNGVPEELNIQISIDKEGNTPIVHNHWYVNKKEEVIHFSSIAGNSSKNNFLLYQSTSASNQAVQIPSNQIYRKQKAGVNSFNIPKYENIRIGENIQKTVKNPSVAFLKIGRASCRERVSSPV